MRVYLCACVRAHSFLHVGSRGFEGQSEGNWEGMNIWGGPALSQALTKHIALNRVYPS